MRNTCQWISHQGRAFEEPASKSATRAPSAAALASCVRATGPTRQGITLTATDSDDPEELREVVASLIVFASTSSVGSCAPVVANLCRPSSLLPWRALMLLGLGGLGHDDDDKEDGSGAGGGTGGPGDGRAFSTLLFWIEYKF